MASKKSTSLKKPDNIKTDAWCKQSSAGGTWVLWKRTHGIPEETNQDDDLYAPGIPNGVPLQYLNKDVNDTCARYHAKNQIESVYTALLGAASNRIMKMSDSTLGYAMKGDRLRPKWALVSRLLSCSWCSMISSFGFHYNMPITWKKHGINQIQPRVDAASALILTTKTPP